MDMTDEMFYSNESSDFGKMYVLARKTNAHFKNILKNKSFTWHLMSLQVRIQRISERVRFNHITVHSLRIRIDRPQQTV